MLAATEVEVGRAEICLSIVSLNLLAFLHEADEGDDTSAGTNHHNGGRVARGYIELRVSNDAHG